MLIGGGGANTFLYTGAQDSTPTAFDTILDFHSGVDHIDLSAVAGGSVELAQFEGSTFVYFEPQANGTFGGVIDVYGTVAPTDIVAPAGTTFVLASGDPGGDTLVGGPVNTFMYGDDGADTLVAGAGAEVMTGGRGADTFQFNSVAASSLNGLTDFISDFNPGEGDIIDLSKLDAIPSTAAQDHFTLVNGFTGVAGQLVVTAPDASNDIYVEGDTTGSGHATFQILVHLNGAMDVSHIHLM